MKKILAIIVVLVLVCAFFSCGEKNPPDVQGENTEDVTSDDTVQTTAEVSEDSTDTEAPTDTVKTADTEKTPDETQKATPADSETESVIVDDDPKETEVPVVINEICAKNNGSYVAPDDGLYDWIELYNKSDKTVNLKGCGLTDKKTEPFKYTFGDVSIKAGGYLVIYAVGDVQVKNKKMTCVPFSLSTDGEKVVLTYPDGTESSIKYPDMAPDEGYGRVDDGEALSFLSVTPGKTNKGAEKIIKVEAPVFSHESGFYGESFKLEMTCEADARIYYTTDGSTPGRDSEVYGNKIVIDNATSKPNKYCIIPGVAEKDFIPTENMDKINVIRAVAIDKEGNVSAETHATYVLLSKEQLNMYKNVSILSVYTDSSNLFDYNNGIYVLGADYDYYMKNEYDPSKSGGLAKANYIRSGREAERPVNIEFFNEKGELCMSQGAGIRISGNYSRANKQKSFKFYARGEYGKGSFDYPLLDDLTDYDSFILRSGGNDWSKAKIRDILAETLVSERNLTTTCWRPCVMFFNGEYWGVYLLIPRYDDHYFAEKYGVDKDNVVMIKNSKIQVGESKDQSLFGELKNFAKKNDLTKPENYEKLCSMIDIESYIEYMCLEICVNNTDWPGNNFGLWRTREVEEGNPYADGKWRFVCLDMDLSMDPGKVSGNTYTKVLSKSFLFQYVYKNKDFEKQFRATLEDMLKNDFAIDKVDSLLDVYEGLLGKQMTLNRKRYNTTANYSNELSLIHQFWQTRAGYVLRYTEELYGK